MAACFHQQCNRIILHRGGCFIVNIKHVIPVKGNIKIHRAGYPVDIGVCDAASAVFRPFVIFHHLCQSRCQATGIGALPVDKRALVVIGGILVPLGVAQRCDGGKRRYIPGSPA